MTFRFTAHATFPKSSILSTGHIDCYIDNKQITNANSLRITVRFSILTNESIADLELQIGIVKIDAETINFKYENIYISTKNGKNNKHDKNISAFVTENLSELI